MSLKIYSDAAKELVNERWVHVALGFGLAAVLPPSCFIILLLLGSPIRARYFESDVAAYMTVLTAGLLLSVIPTVLFGLPLYLMRQRLGVFRLPLALALAAIGGAVTTVIVAGGVRLLDYGTGSLFGIPSAIALWWFALRVKTPWPTT
jgi:hypothetical protein